MKNAFNHYTNESIAGKPNFDMVATTAGEIMERDVYLHQIHNVKKPDLTKGVRSPFSMYLEQAM